MFISILFFKLILDNLCFSCHLNNTQMKFITLNWRFCMINFTCKLFRWPKKVSWHVWKRFMLNGPKDKPFALHCHIYGDIQNLTTIPLSPIRWQIKSSDTNIIFKYFYSECQQLCFSYLSVLLGVALTNVINEKKHFFKRILLIENFKTHKHFHNVLWSRPLLISKPCLRLEAHKVQKVNF